MKKKELLTALVEHINEINAETGVDAETGVGMGVWNIITFLRGPDVENKKLKTYTTARVRAVVGMVYRYFADVNDTPLTPHQIKARDEFLRKAPKHFYRHWLMVIDAVRELYNYDLQEERPL